MKMQKTTKPHVVPERIIKEILNTSIPEKSERHLVNPLKKNRRSSVRRKSAADRPESISLWTPRDLVDYFAERYKDALGVAYIPNYASDQQFFKQLFSILASNGLDKGVWGKMFVDWCIERWESIRKEHRGFYPQVIVQQCINRYLQEVVMPKVETQAILRDKHDLSMLDEIVQAEKDNRLMEVFARHGMPVGFTYLIGHRAMSRESAIASFNKYIDNLMATQEGKSRFEAVVIASIMGSPYPPEFEMLDWREVFATYIDRFKDENWWRDYDYSGQPLPKYHGLLSGAISK